MYIFPKEFWTGTIQTSKSQPKGLLNNETYIRHPKSYVDTYKDVKSLPQKFLQKLRAPCKNVKKIFSKKKFPR